MKVVYCINGAYNSGGMERVLMNKANYLADVLGYEVLIVTTDRKGRIPFFTFSSNIRIIDLGINYINDKNNPLWIRLLKKQRKLFIHRKRLEALLKKERPDICISMFDMDAGFLYKIKDGSKKVLEYHFSKNAKIIEATNPIVQWAQKLRIQRWTEMVQKYNYFVVLTEEDKEAWGNLSNIVVIPNALSSFPTEIASLNEKTVLSVGRISYQKGFDRLIKAWEIVHKSHPEWKLRIRGNGNKEQLLQQIATLELDDSIQILPATSEIDTEYLNSSIYVMSSRYEGFPMVLLEAMSYGLPIASFSCPCGPKDIITHGIDGLLCEDGDIEELARTILLLIEDRSLREKIGRAAKQRSLDFSAEKIMKMWENLFVELMV